MYLIKPKNHKGAIAIDPVDHRFVSFKLAGSGYYLDSILWYDFMVFFILYPYFCRNSWEYSHFSFKGGLKSL